ncbi:hypothetical protein FB381_3450 [Nocardioides albertanoniae]|uniref:Uncharacterized protein n=1 Tax=Nocardioides albertanoniae TaxID=1175486 RepID=A0A543AAK4_9ACTN|nr:hypothetical protein [Nocardioides albertanoniae]TQL69540.1 hypothetical protein FB381_3450 [Nocardioides albertanoniae]
MTDNDLRTLLRDAADEVAVPRLATDELHLRTRTISRRRRARWGAGAAAVAMAGVLGAYALSGSLRGDEPHIAAAVGDPRGWAVAEGASVHFGDGSVVTYGGSVNDLRYTSVGMLARSTQSNTRLSLITTAGVEPLDLGDVSDRLIGTAPDSPYVSWTVADGDGWLVRVVDLGTGEKVADVPITGKYTWAGWKTPPVAVDGEHAYVALDDRTLDVDWRAGRVSTSKGLPGSYTTEVIDGRAVTQDARGTTQRVVEVATGEVLLTVHSSDFPADLVRLKLSPDGNRALATPYVTCDENDECRYDMATAPIYDLAQGTETAVALDDRIGWTPEGHLIRVAGTKVEVCDEVGQECADAPITLKKRVDTISGTMNQS